MTAVPLALDAPPEPPLLAGRYHVLETLPGRRGIERWVARDDSIIPAAWVQILREGSPGEPTGLAWQERLRARCRHHGLPRILDRFAEGDDHYLVLDWPIGVHLWDAWDDEQYSDADRYGWLIQLADLLQVLHAAGVMLEDLRPDQVILTEGGHVILADPCVLLPMPLPPQFPIVRSYASAPELIAGDGADARCDLFCFGALVSALLLGRELADIDFASPGVPKSYLARFPDAHPLIGRLISKTFTESIPRRFPTADGFTVDPSGFQELIALLEQCQRSLGRSRLEVAAWTNTGISRSGNEDAFAVLKTSVGRQDELDDYALLVVADGMGGNEAGEVAAGLAVRSLYQTLSAKPPFAKVSAEPDLCPPHGAETFRSAIVEALKEANRTVYLASRQGIGRRGMGCTAEAVITDGRRLIVGHVGDSRTYRFHRGDLALLTRDQTYVNRLVELGDITPEEAQFHPRRAELQQAVGGWSDVEPEIIDEPIVPGDWILVCSDGLSNAVRPAAIREVLERSRSAEHAARQLVNLANLAGAPDNATAVVLRAV